MLPDAERLAGADVALLARFLHRIGCRLGEALAARAEDMHRERGGVQIWLNRATKRGKKRSILLNAAEELLPVLPVRGRLFPGLPDDVAKVSSMWAQFWRERREEAEARAALEGRGLTEWEERRWRLHDLRHAFACEAIRAEADLRALQLHLGHSNYATTEHYLETLKELPVAQRRSLKLFWRGKKEGAGAAADPGGAEQPELDAKEGALLMEEAEVALHPGAFRGLHPSA